MPCFWCKLFIWFQYYQGEYFQWYLLYIKAWSWVVVFSLPVILGMVNKVWCKRDTVCLLLCDIMQQNFWYPTVHSHYKKGLQDITYTLGLLLEGTKAVLVEKIKKYLNQNSQLKDNNHFARLFASHAWDLSWQQQPCHYSCPMPMAMPWSHHQCSCSLS